MINIEVSKSVGIENPASESDNNEVRNINPVKIILGEYT